MVFHFQIQKFTTKSLATLVQERIRACANKGVTGFPSSKPIICISLSHVSLMLIEWWKIVFMNTCRVAYINSHSIMFSLNLHKMFWVGTTLSWGPYPYGESPLVMATMAMFTLRNLKDDFCNFQINLLLTLTWYVVAANNYRFDSCHRHKPASLTWLVNCLQWLLCNLTCSIVTLDQLCHYSWANSIFTGCFSNIWSPQ